MKPQSAITTESIASLAAKFIHISEQNTRQPTAKEVTTSGLVDSMREQGQITPGIGRPHPTLGKGHVELCAGARRSVAAAILEVPFKVVIREMTDSELLDIILTENLQRTDPDPEAEARLIEIRLAEGLTPAEICARYGKSELWIKRRMKLLDIIPAIRKALGKDMAHFTTGMKERLGALSTAMQKELVKDGQIQHARTDVDLINVLQRQSASLKGATWLNDPATFVPGCGPGCATDTAASLFPEAGESCGTCLNRTCFRMREGIAKDNARKAALNGYKIEDVILYSTSGWERVFHEGKELTVLQGYQFKERYKISKEATAHFGLDITNPLAPRLVSLTRISKQADEKSGPKETREDKLTGRRLAVLNAKLAEWTLKAPLPTDVPIINLAAAFGMNASRGDCSAKSDHDIAWKAVEIDGEVTTFDYFKNTKASREETIWQSIRPILKRRLIFAQSRDLLSPWKQKEMTRIASLTGFDYEAEWLAACASLPVPKSWGTGIDPITLKSTMPAAKAKPVEKTATKKATKKAAA